MSKVWRRLQRVGKKASKFRFATFGHVLTINCSSKWQPDKITINWSRRGRKISSKASQWEPSLGNVYEGLVKWDKSIDVIEFDVTLYRGINDNEYEEKEWVLMVESEDSKGKKRLLATGKFDLEKYVSIEPTSNTEIKNLKLKTTSEKIKSASISFSLACQFVKEGKATDEDMISIASFMSNASSITTNPYLNSNFIFDNKKNKHIKSNAGSNSDINDLDDDFQINDDFSSFNKNSTLTSTNYNDDENNEDDIDYYLNMQNKLQSDLNFNSISHNFRRDSNDFQKNFLKTLDSNTEDKNSSTDYNKFETIKAKNENKENLDITNQNKKDLTEAASVFSHTEKIQLPTSQSKPMAPVIINKSSNVQTNSLSTKILSTSNIKALPDQHVTEIKKTASGSDIHKINASEMNPFTDEPESKPLDVNDKSNPFIEDDTKEDISTNPFIDETNPFSENDQKPEIEIKSSNSTELKPVEHAQVNVVEKTPTKTVLPADDTYYTLSATKTSKDLLDWCKDTIKSTKKDSALFKSLTINDFSSSWANGIAFCSIIYHFRPALINVKEVTETDIKANLQQAFKATDSEYINRVLDYSDIINKKNIDQLSVMTYLYQIRDHFDTSKSHKETKKSSLFKKKLFKLPAPSPPTPTPSNSTASTPSVKLTPSSTLPLSNKNTPIKAMAPTTPIVANDLSKPKSNFLNPFDSDDETDDSKIAKTEKQSPTKSGFIEIKPNGEIIDAASPKLNTNYSETNLNEINPFATNSNGASKRVSRRNSTNSTSSSSSSLSSPSTHLKDRKSIDNGKPLANNSNSEDLNTEELIQRAKQLIEKNKQPLIQNLEDAEPTRKEEIKQRAKKIIAETKRQSQTRRKSASSSKESFSSNQDNNNFRINDKNNNNICQDKMTNHLLSRSNSTTTNVTTNDQDLIGTEYINQEILNLKAKQRELDEQGYNLEKQLRLLMKQSSNDDTKSKKINEKDRELEDHLLKEWFLLINKKNALIHQQQELEILQNEKNLERRYEILSNQLRYLMQIDDFNKTDEQKRNETILFNELISLVNKRNELVLQLDEENKLLNEGEMINEYIQNKTSFQQKEKPCVIQ